MKRKLSPEPIVFSESERKAINKAIKNATKPVVMTVTAPGRKELSSKIKSLVAAATVRMTKLGGQGVLVPGGFILTAAHCIGWTAEGGMALGDYSPEPIQAGDTNLTVEPLAVEPCMDIAALAAMDDQACPDLYEAFETWREKTKPVQVCFDGYEFFKPFPVWFLSHKGEWIAGTAKQCGVPFESAILAIEADAQIVFGTSGGPVVDSRGRLVGVVSRSGGVVDDEQNFVNESSCDAGTPRPHLALPVWIVERIRAAQIAESGKASDGHTFKKTETNPRRPMPGGA